MALCIKSFQLSPIIIKKHYISPFKKLSKLNLGDTADTVSGYTINPWEFIFI
jgi:hypothetical protein